MRIYDRTAKIWREEKEYGGKSLEFLYRTMPGRILLKIFFSRRIYSELNGLWMKIFFSRRIYSELNGLWMKSPLSVRKIKHFIQEYHIDLSDCERKDFKSFNDFFTRKCSFRTDAGAEDLISPCRGRLSAYVIDEGLVLKIKGSTYTLPELVDNRFELSQYAGGRCLVYRLAMQDCHRYFFCDEGEVLRTEEIPGILHTVRPISEAYRVFCRNHRSCTLMRTKHFGDMIQIEVGALQIGRINNHEITGFSRMEEKGYFSYGGSTIIQMFTKGAVSLDEDIQRFSEGGTEVLVRAGEKIGSTV